jgi:hypothetical protein
MTKTPRPLLEATCDALAVIVKRTKVDMDTFTNDEVLQDSVLHMATYRWIVKSRGK